MLLFLEQCLNGLQFGLLLFLLAAGLTLVFGIMDMVNLAHGSLYMVGAYFAATFVALCSAPSWRSAPPSWSGWRSRWWRSAGSMAATISIMCSARSG
jgi:branched-subunit amino acid ABC-type transport system permease component